MRVWLLRTAAPVNSVDRRLTRRIGRFPRTWVDAALCRLTRTANHGVLWFAIAAVLAARRGPTRRAAMRGVLAIAWTSFTANAVGKPLMPRRRPAADALPRWRALPNPPTSSSFPSGHAASAAAFATAVGMEAPLAGALIAPLAATVAYSRVHTGVHWPSDVAAGAALGAGVALATRRWWPVRPVKPAVARPHADAPALPDGEGLVLACNPRSGPGGTDPVAEVNAALPKARVVLLDDGGDLVAELSAAVDRDTRAVGVAGGDGSVAAAASVAVRHGLPLVVLPCGTLNHFARDVGVESVAAAAEAVNTGQAVSVDLACVGERPFLNTASLGGYPDLVRLREKWQQRWGKWPAAGAALIRVLAAARPVSMRIDGVPRKVWIFFVGNGPYHPRGMAPVYRPRLDSGQLDVRYLRADLPWSRTRFVLGALGGALLHSRTYVQREARSVHVRVLGQTVDLATDGEVIAAGRDFEFRVDAASLVVYRPKP